MAKMTKPVTVLWWPGDNEDDLFGFVTKQDRDACARGEPGPFRRIVRDLTKRPITEQEAFMRGLFAKWEAGRRAIAQEKQS